MDELPKSSSVCPPDPEALEDFPQSDASDPASDTSDISDFSDEALTLILKLDPPDPNEEKLRLEDFLQTDLDEEDLEPFPQQDPLDLNVEALVQARELLAHRDPSSPSEEALELEQVHHPDLPYPDAPIPLYAAPLRSAPPSSDRRCSCTLL
ncbi:hypothetical protein WMY93_024658 [Mugilogobius chulae]|uniref:Uncharacterized protein n=1 Tax=Mugilogobius chulae TaxID=88201 RepID=A0AAW0N1W8_9GOBI